MSKHNHYIFLSIIYIYTVLTRLVSRKHALVHTCVRDHLVHQQTEIEAILSVSSIRRYRHSRLTVVHGADLADLSGNRMAYSPSIG
jgi:hypothetical protein